MEMKIDMGIEKEGKEGEEAETLEGDRVDLICRIQGYTEYFPR